MCKVVQAIKRLPSALVCCTALLVVDGLAQAEDSQFTFNRLESFVQSYCVDCHAGELAEADLQLDRYRDLTSVLDQRDRWEKVVDYLSAGLMPPDGSDRPPDDEVHALVDWLRPQIEQADAAAPADPGRVTMRRLNRTEYNNTIRDLVGVEFRPADDFPADEVGYGFDNIGDVLALPPALLEKYLAAAEEIARRAIITEPQRPPVHPIDPASLKARQTRAFDGRVFSSNARAFKDVEFAEGEYIVRIAANGDQAGDEPARMSLRLGDDEIATFDVIQRRDEAPGRYEAHIHAQPRTYRLAIAFANDYWNPDAPDPGDRDRNLILHSIEIEGPIDRPVPLPESHTRILFRTPAEGAAVDDVDQCARELLTRFATRAYRRTVESAEIDRLVALVRLARDDGANFAESIQLAVQAVLASPHFLFRVEPTDSSAPDDPQSLNDFALASRLSYFLWSSLPDEELHTLAERGTLREPAVLDGQVRRMLADPKSQALVEGFAGQWLQLRNLTTASPNPKQFPSFDPEMRVAMRTETEMFFAAVMREDRSIVDFLNGDFTFVNGKLAEHYGISGIEGPEFQRVSLAGTPRGGLLTQASILTVTSNPTRTSPVKRGKFVLDQLLGTPLPPPPPGVPELEEGPEIDQAASLRKRMEQHRANAGCAACHARLDPLGFSLENFDPVGAWRDTDGEVAIDASGVLPDGTEFSGPQALREILVDKADQFRRCFAEKMLTYALGRGTERYDRKAISQICAAVNADGDRFSRLILEVVKSEPFQRRRVEAIDPTSTETTGG